MCIHEIVVELVRMHTPFCVGSDGAAVSSNANAGNTEARNAKQSARDVPSFASTSCCEQSVYGADGGGNGGTPAGAATAAASSEAAAAAPTAAARPEPVAPEAAAPSEAATAGKTQSNGTPDARVVVHIVAVVAILIVGRADAAGKALFVGCAEEGHWAPRLRHPRIAYAFPLKHATVVVGIGL